MITKKIIIGGAQLGMNYGIANHNGQIAENEAKKIFNLAHSMKIDMIDTAFQYGSSESVIGKIANSNFKIITKLSPLPININHLADYVKNQFFLSLDRLKRKSCEGLLVHHAEDLLGARGASLYEVLLELKYLNRVKKIGISVYSPEQIYPLVDRFKLDIIQFPINLFDQRFLQNNLLENLKNYGIELHARSIFLQGLLLIDNSNISSYFNAIKPALNSLKKECQEKGIKLREALIEFVASIYHIDYCIFGIDSFQQFQEIVNDFINCDSVCRIQSKKYICNDINIINPMNWRVK
jgi:aryl-alcohol dehydrogenase-like predicted oxidoreductase